MIIGKIESIEKKDGISKTTGKPYVLWEFMIGGQRYSSFEGSLSEKFKVGEDVEVLGFMKRARDGKEYFNMTDLKAYTGNITEDIPVVKPQMDNRQNSIERQSCLRSAIDYCGDVPVEEVLSIAETMVNWVRK